MQPYELICSGRRTLALELRGGCQACHRGADGVCCS